MRFAPANTRQVRHSVGFNVCTGRRGEGVVFMTIIVATIIGSVKRDRKIRAGLIVANIIVLEIRGGRAEAGEAGG